LIAWANTRLPAKLQLSDSCGQIHTGLALFRLAEQIKGRPSEPPVPDHAFPTNAGDDDRLDGLFKLMDFFLDNNVGVENVSINDVRQGNRGKVLHVLRCLRTWEDGRKALARKLSRTGAYAGPFMAMDTSH